jgi:hypothetical protein
VEKDKEGDIVNRHWKEKEEGLKNKSWMEYCKRDIPEESHTERRRFPNPQ